MRCKSFLALGIIFLISITFLLLGCDFTLRDPHAPDTLPPQFLAVTHPKPNTNYLFYIPIEVSVSEMSTNLPYYKISGLDRVEVEVFDTNNNLLKRRVFSLYGQNFQEGYLGNVTLNVNGLSYYIMQLKVYDRAGNYSTYGPIRFGYSNIVYPSVVFDEPSLFYTNTDTVVVKGRAWIRAENDGIDKVLVIIGSSTNLASGTTNWEYTVSGLVLGNNVIEALAVSYLNVTNQSVPYITVVYDNTPPTVTVSSPTNSPIPQEISFYANIYEDYFLDLESPRLLAIKDTVTNIFDGYLNGSLWKFDFSTTVTGSYVFRIEAKDMAGNIGATNLTLEVNSSIPIVRILDPEENIYIHTNSSAVSVKISGRTFDGNRITNLSIWVSNSETQVFSNVLNPNSTNFTIITNLTLPVGENTLYTRAISESGSSSEIKKTTFVIDNIKPIVLFYNITNNQEFTTNPIYFSIITIDSNFTDGVYTYVSTSGQTFILGGSYQTNTNNITLTPSPGRNEIKTWAIDYFGNYSTTNTIYVYYFDGAVYVSTTGSDSNPGTRDYPLKSLERAIVKATNLGITNIKITEGTYNTAGINVSFLRNIRILGGYDSTFSYISGKSRIVSNQQAVFNLHGVSNVYIKDVFLDKVFLKVSSSTNITVENSIISNSSGTNGIRISDSTNILLLNIQAINNNRGVKITTSSDVKIRNSYIQNNINEGIYISSSRNSTISNSHVYNNSSYGIYFTGTTNVSIYNSSIHRNGNGGLYLISSSNVIIQEVGVHYNTNSIFTIGAGVIILGSTTIDISSLTVSNNINLNSNGSGGGVYIGSSRDILFSGINNVQYNNASTGGGVYIGSSRDILFSGINNVQYNNASTGGGVYIKSSSNISFYGTSYVRYNNATDLVSAIYILDSTNVTLNATVEYNGLGSTQPTVRISRGFGNVISGLIQNNQGSDAILIESSTSNRISADVINNTSGISITESTNILVSKSNGKIYFYFINVGVRITESSNVIVSNYTILNNLFGSGIEILNSQDIIISNTSIISNSAGIYVDGSKNISINSVIKHNKGSMFGSFPGIRISSSSNVFITGSITSNYIIYYYNSGGIMGTALYIKESSDVVISNLTVSSNAGVNNNSGLNARGVGAYIENSSVAILSSIFEQNYVSNKMGIIYVQNPTNLLLQNNIFTNNSFSGLGGSNSIVVLRANSGSTTASNLRIIGNTFSDAFCAIWENGSGSSDDIEDHTIISNSFSSNTLSNLYRDPQGTLTPEFIPASLLGITILNISNADSHDASVAGGNSLY